MFSTARSNYRFLRLDKLLEEIEKLNAKFYKAVDPKQKIKLLKQIVKMEDSLQCYAENKLPNVTSYGVCYKMVAKLN